MADYLPESDADLVAWTKNFVDYASGRLAALGLDKDDLDPVATSQTAFGLAFDAHLASQSAARSAARTKDDARAVHLAAVRTVVRKIQGDDAVTNADREALGISLRGGDRAPVGTPATRPALSIDTSQRLRHGVAFVDQATPTSRARPDGVMGCEIWVKVGGGAPTDPSELRFLALDTRTPYVAEFGGEDVGKTAHYMARWTSTRGEHGPWSETASATVGG